MEKQLRVVLAGGMQFTRALPQEEIELAAASLEDTTVEFLKITTDNRAWIGKGALVAVFEEDTPEDEEDGNIGN